MTPDRSLRNPWPEGGAGEDPRGGGEYAELHAAQRLLQDRLTGAALPAELAADVTARLRELTELLDAHQVDESGRLDGWRADLPGRGHPLLPPYVIDGADETSMHGRVTFTRFHLGGNGAAHGGTQPLLFDDILGRVVNHGRPGLARTAYLHVNFRRITPLDVELRYEATLDKVEGRKRFAGARLLDASGQVLADAEGLFVELLPGQA